MAQSQIASDLAAVHYAATLRADPTLTPDRQADQLATYRDLGDTLAASVLSPPTALIRCHIPPRPGQRPRLIATVHDRYLLVVQDHRGPNAFGMRLIRHLLVDLRMAAREGHDSVSVFCPLGDRHELPFRWLRSARGYVTSDRTEPFVLNPAGDYVDPQGRTAPDDGHSLHALAFAITTGPLDGMWPVITTTWLRAALWWTRFGPNPPYDTHLQRLIGKRDFRGTLRHSSLISGGTWAHPGEAAAAIRRIEGAHR